MIAKCLQNLANLVEFGVKESYMEVVNPFILKNKERMVVFLDHLSVSERTFIKDYLNFETRGENDFIFFFATNVSFIIKINLMVLFCLF